MEEKSNIKSRASQVSTKDWIDKLKKDIKQENLDSLHWEIDDSFRFNPVQSGKDFIPNIGLYYHREGHQLGASSITVTDEAEANQKAMGLLEKGIGSIIFHIKKSEVDYDALLNGIITSMVRVICVLNKEVKNHPSDDHVMICHQDLTPTINLSSQIGTICEACATFLKPRIERSNFENGVVFLTLTDNVYINMATPRALRICWNEAQESNPRKLTIIGEGEINADEPARSLLENTTKVVSGIVGGVDHIEFNKSIEDSFTNEQRLHQNILHLTYLEAQMPLNEDVLEGSIFFNALTQKLANKIWKQLNDQITQS